MTAAVPHSYVITICVLGNPHALMADCRDTATAPTHLSIPAAGYFWVLLTHLGLGPTSFLASLTIWEFCPFLKWCQLLAWLLYRKAAHHFSWFSLGKVTFWNAFLKEYPTNVPWGLFSHAILEVPAILAICPDNTRWTLQEGYVDSVFFWIGDL